MPTATCKSCRHPVVWAALEGESVPFEVAVLQDERPTFDLYMAHGTWRARATDPSTTYTTPYRRHNCRKDTPQR